jgi:hypothetical protein
VTVQTSEAYVYQRPSLYPKQQEALFSPERYGVVEASTKSGKTVGCIAWLFEQAITPKDGTGMNFWWVAPVKAQASIAYRRTKRSIPKYLYTSNETSQYITLGNGSVIWFKTAEDPDNLFGEDVFAAVIDEASRVREESWHAVRSTLTATRGPIRIIGNVKGRRNWFWKMSRRAEAGDSPQMRYSKITWKDAVDAGVLEKEEIDDARTQLPDQVFRELYEAEASDDQGNPFGYESIRACVGALSQKPPIAWGWDLARAKDWTVGIALDVDGAVCRFYRFQHPWQETTEWVKQETAGKPALVDSRGVGDPIVENLQRDGKGRFEGYAFNPYGDSSKQKLMEGLQVAIQQRNMPGEMKLTFPEGPIFDELDAFEYEYTRTLVKYAAPQGMHDDCVCSLALAVKKWLMVRKYVSPEGRKPAFMPRIW